MPALFLPADMPTMLAAIRAWVVAQIGTNGALVAQIAAPYSVIWADQDAPYPGHPYATLRLVTPPTIIGYGMGSRAWVDDGHGGLIDRTEFDSEFGVRVELFSRAPLDPLSGLDETARAVHAVALALYTSSQVEAFDVAGLAIVDSIAPVYVPRVAGFGFERRAYFDTIFRARTRVDVAAAPVLDNTSVVAVQATGQTDGSVDGSVGS